MGRKERKRYEDNDHVRTLIEESKIRELTICEIQEIREKYTGAGGLVASSWDNGQFFTPPEVCSFVIGLLQIPADSRVLEPSCGGGAFISALTESCQVVGIEQMHETARVATLINPNAIIHQGDTLEMLPDMEGKFEFCIGNPPYCDIQHCDTYVGYEIAPKSRRAEWYFIELAVKSLVPGGVVALVVPDGILGNAKDKDRRKWLMDTCWLRGVISLPQETFLKVGTGCKTSVLIIQRPFENVELIGKDYSIFMAVASKIGWDSRGRTTESDLPKVLEAWRQMYPLGLGPHTPIILSDPKMLEELGQQLTESSVTTPTKTPINEPVIPLLEQHKALQTNVVDMGAYRKKKQSQTSQQMGFDFDIVNG